MFLWMFKYIDHSYLLSVVVGGAPAQRHGQRVSEGLLGVAAGGETDRLDVPAYRYVLVKPDFLQNKYRSDWSYAVLLDISNL